MQEEKKPHQPQRFETYTELTDGSGFTIEGSEHVFKFDRYGGWFDEFGNYYNQDGNAQEPPELSNQSISSSSREYSGDEYNEDDDDIFERQFGRPQNNDFESDDEGEKDSEVMVMEHIASNLLALSLYPPKKPLRVSFSNMAYKYKKQEIVGGYKKRVEGIINVVLQKNEKKMNNGMGYFVISDSDKAEELIKLEGVRVLDRELRFHIETVEDFLLNPITQQEMKNYHAKSKEEKLTQKHINPAHKWNFYQFQKALFPKKSIFHQWMNDNGLIYELDYKDIEKINKEEKQYVKIELKEHVFNSLNGKEFEGKKIQFLPLEPTKPIQSTEATKPQNDLIVS